MRIKELLLAIVSLVVAGFYAFESFLSFQANGFTAPLLAKLLVCGGGIYLFLSNAKRIRRRKQ